MNVALRYPVPAAHLSLHLTAEKCTLYRIRRGDKLSRRALGIAEWRQWTVPRSTAHYLSLCDGARTHEEIVEALSRVMEPLLAEALGDEAAAALEADGLLRMESGPSVDHGFAVTGGFDSFAPLHMSIEITDTCNFRCAHCYVSASPEKHGRKNGIQTISMLDKLARSGVRVIELTGGECTTHPEFKDILQHASRTFCLVAMITNGYLLGRRPDLVQFVADLPNVVVQVSIDGLREFHDKFRCMEGSFDAAMEAIRGLRRQDVFVRIGMSVTEQNLDQVLPVFHLAKELGVNALSCAPVTSFGRGTGMAGCADTEFHVMHRIGEQLRPYADDPLFEAQRREVETFQRGQARNCGAGWRSFALNHNGQVRSCLYLADSKKFGNVDSQDYDAIFRQREMRLFHDAPSPGGAECSGPQPDGSTGCRYLNTCRGCFAKAFRISEKEYPQCPWRAKYFPGMSLRAPSEINAATGASNPKSGSATGCMIS